MIKHTLFILLSCSTVTSFAAVPATRAERADLLDTKLRNLPLSDLARALLSRSSWWAAQNVSGLATMNSGVRRSAFVRVKWLERELAKVLRSHELRFSLTGAELRAYADAGRAPGLTLRSALDAVTLTARARRALDVAGCRTLADVRDNLLEATLYGTAPLVEPVARELRRLRYLPLTEGAVITADEFEFGERLAEARLGRRARQLLLDHGVRTRRELRALPLDEIARRGPVEKKVIGQVRALLYGDCGRKFDAAPKSRSAE